MKSFFSNTSIRNGLLVVAGIFLGWLFFHPSGKTGETQQSESVEKKPTIWTCSMHPQIRRTEPGKCPICGMDLIPLVQQTAKIDPDAIQFTKEAAALANVMTSVVSRQHPVKDIRLYGKIQPDERLLQTLTAHFPGRIETLQVNYTGERVRKGQTLALIYSPELVTAEQELIEAAKLSATQPELYEAAKDRLRQWKLTDHQIAAIERSRKVKETIGIVSPISGIVTSKRVSTGDYVSQGTVLFDVADFSRLWVVFDAYESDLPFLTAGARISFTFQALPGVTNTGTIAFIDPVIDPVTRAARIRVEISNRSGRLKPEMFATGVVHATLAGFHNQLVIPASAVLWTGKRSVVYVKQPGFEDPVFKLREVELGPALGESYVIERGLNEGEAVVTQGTFNVDAAAQLEGKPSMMNHESM